MFREKKLFNLSSKNFSDLLDYSNLSSRINLLNISGTNFHGVDSDSNSLGGTILKSGGNKPPFLIYNRVYKLLKLWYNTISKFKGQK